MADEVQHTADSRRSERQQLEGAVTVRFEAAPLTGSGQNISREGVFFVAEGRVPVRVEIEGRDGAIPGELVRIENMGSGMVGIAVKFDAAHDDLVPDA